MREMHEEEKLAFSWSIRLPLSWHLVLIFPEASDFGKLVTEDEVNIILFAQTVSDLMALG